MREAARKVWPDAAALAGDIDVDVHIVNYHTLPPLDVDNVIKPVLDGLNSVVYDDDSQVQRVASERIQLEDMDYPEAAVRAAANLYSEFLYIEVTWI